MASRTATKAPSKPAPADDHEDEFFSEDESDVDSKPKAKIEEKKSSPPPRSAAKTSKSSSDEDIPAPKKAVSVPPPRKAAAPSRFAKKAANPTYVSWVRPNEFSMDRLVKEEWEFGTPKVGPSYIQRKFSYDLSKKADGSQKGNVKIYVNATLDAFRGVEFNEKGYASIGLSHPRGSDEAMENVKLIQKLYAECTKDYDDSVEDPSEFGAGKIKTHLINLKKDPPKRRVPWYEKKDEKTEKIDESRGISVYFKLIEYPANEKRKEPLRATKFKSPGGKLIPWEKLAARHVVIKEMIWTWETEYASKGGDHTFRLKLNECTVVSALPMGNESELPDDGEDHAEEDDDFWDTLNQEASASSDSGKKSGKSGGTLDEEEGDEDDEEETLKKVLANGNRGGKK